MSEPIVSSISSCTYPSYAGQAWTIVHYIPWIVPLFIFAASITPRKDGRGGTQLILKLYALWLSLMQIVLYLLQVYFKNMRADPYCTDVYNYGFPSLKAYYWSAGLTYIIMFCYLYNMSLGWFWWTFIFLVFAGPQSMLVWMLYNTWQEALVSSLIGIISTGVFLLLIRFIVQDYFPYLINMFPFTYMGATDTYIMTPKQEALSTAIRERMERFQGMV